MATFAPRLCHCYPAVGSGSFVAQGFVAVAWVHPSYSWSSNYISDLGRHVVDLTDVATAAARAAGSQDAEARSGQASLPG